MIKKIVLGLCLIGAVSTCAQALPITPITMAQYTSNAFISKWRTWNAGTSTFNQITIPVVAAASGGTYNCVVNWGDGNQSSISSDTDPRWTHTYTTSGDYTVVITGKFTGIQFNNGGDKLKLLNISQWGSLRLGNTGNYFYGCSNLTITAPDILNLTGTTTLSRLFQGCSSITTIPNINNWNVSGVTNMDVVFYATSFNSNIASWNVSSVTTMSFMFGANTAFNQPLGGWNVSSCTYMGNMFEGATAFNQNIASWNVSNVTVMSNMFKLTPFNYDISSWNVAKVTAMARMFEGATAFNQNLNAWTTSALTNTSFMFQNCSTYNQPITWDMSKVTNLQGMFSNATSFNQNIGSWNVTAVTNAANFLDGVTLSKTNYNALLAGWGAQVVKTGVTLSGGNSHYDGSTGGYDGTTGRGILTGTYSWTITDGGTP